MGVYYSFNIPLLLELKMKIIAIGAVTAGGKKQCFSNIVQSADTNLKM